MRRPPPPASPIYCNSSKMPSGLVTFDTQGAPQLCGPVLTPATSNCCCTNSTTPTADNQTDVADVFAELVPQIGRRGMVALVSDLFVDAGHSWPKHFKQLRLRTARGHRATRHARRRVDVSLRRQHTLPRTRNAGAAACRPASAAAIVFRDRRAVLRRRAQDLRRCGNRLCFDEHENTARRGAFEQLPSLSTKNSQKRGAAVSMFTWFSSLVNSTLGRVVVQPLAVLGGSAANFTADHYPPA